MVVSSWNPNQHSKQAFVKIVNSSHSLQECSDVILLVVVLTKCLINVYCDLVPEKDPLFLIISGRHLGPKKETDLYY